VLPQALLEPSTKAENDRLRARRKGCASVAGCGRFADLAIGNPTTRYRPAVEGQVSLVPK